MPTRAVHRSIAGFPVALTRITMRLALSMTALLLQMSQEDKKLPKDSTQERRHRNPAG